MTPEATEIHHLPFASLTPVERGKGIVNFPIVTAKFGAKNIKSGITRLPVGATVPGHFHDSEEQVTVLEGKVRFSLGGKTFECGPYDSTFISAKVPHEFMNVGDSPAVVMVVYGGPSTTRTFISTGETVEIGSERDRFPPPQPLSKS
jgi:quercetin dioxygenase-like cupin family protein